MGKGNTSKEDYHNIKKGVIDCAWEFVHVSFSSSQSSGGNCSGNFSYSSLKITIA